MKYLTLFIAILFLCGCKEYSYQIPPHELAKRYELLHDKYGDSLPILYVINPDGSLNIGETLYKMDLLIKQ